MIDIWDSVEVWIAGYRDKTNAELLARFKEEYYLTLHAEAEARRSKTTTLIKNIAKLRIELKKFEFTYALVKIKTGDIKSIEDMIRSLNHEINKMVSQKTRSVLRH